MIQDKDKDKDKDEYELDNAIKYFQSIMFNNITKYSKHKMGATFIGIKTNISGIYTPLNILNGTF
jgi:hypothetical protein